MSKPLNLASLNHTVIAQRFLNSSSTSEIHQEGDKGLNGASRASSNHSSRFHESDWVWTGILSHSRGIKHSIFRAGLSVCTFIRRPSGNSLSGWKARLLVLKEAGLVLGGDRRTCLYDLVNCRKVGLACTPRSCPGWRLHDLLWRPC